MLERYIVSGVRSAGNESLVFLAEEGRGCVSRSLLVSNPNVIFKQGEPVELGDGNLTRYNPITGETEVFPYSLPDKE